MKKGLGKGLDALFEENSFDIADRPVTEVRVADIEPDRNQPRRDFDADSLSELADSIKRNGVISPLIITPTEGGRYRIIAGERRWRASKLAGLETVPVIVRDCSDEQISEISLVENLQRKDLNPLEEAFGYKRLMENYGLTQEQASERVSKSRSAVTNALRLLSLPEQALDFLRTGELSAGHARALLALENADMIVSTADRVISEELSVRQTEELVKKLKAGVRQKYQPDAEVQMAIAELVKRAETGTGNRIRIKHTPKNTGRIEIFYNSTAELEKLIDMLS